MGDAQDRRAKSRAAGVEGLHNARDLGGLECAGGERTPYGVFYRSENLDAVTERGWERLHELGVRTVIDLRQPGEVEQHGYQRPEWLTVTQVDHDGLGDNPRFWSDYWGNGLVGTALYYLPHLAAMPERSAAVLTAIARADAGGVLFHCMSGRDRTGLIALLLLAVAEVDSEAIVEDYLDSVRNGAEVARARERPDGESACEALCREHGTTTEGAFRAAVSGLDQSSVLDLLCPADRERITSWRGALAP